MKKRLASLLLATAFVFAAGAAFAWTDSVPAGGDFRFNGVKEAKGVLSDGLKFAPLIGNNGGVSYDRMAFNVAGVVTSNDPGKGVSFDTGAKSSSLYVRVPVTAGVAATGTWKFRGFGNTSEDKPISLDVKVNNSNKKDMDVSWPTLVGITSQDIGYQDGNITWKVSKDVFGWKTVQVSFDVDNNGKPKADWSTGSRRSMDLNVCFVKNVPAVRVHYFWDNANSGDVIVDLSKDKIVELALPVVRSTSVSGKMYITKIENIGNASFVLDATVSGDKLTVVDKKAPGLVSGNKVHSGGIVGKNNNGAEVTSSDSGLSVFSLSGGYGLTVKWPGAVKQSDATFALEAKKASADAVKANNTLDSFGAKEQSLALKAGGKKVSFPKEIASADFTGYSAVVKAYPGLKNVLAATGFKLTPKDAVASADAGVVMPEMTFVVDHNKAIADGVFKSEEWTSMLGKTGSDMVDAFLAKMTITFGVGGTVYDLVKFIDASGFKRSDFISVAKDNNNVKVTVKGFYLVDGTAGDIAKGKGNAVAGFKAATVDGIPVVMFGDGVADNAFAMDVAVNKAEKTDVKVYAVTGTVKGSDGAGIEGVVVALGTTTPTSTDKTGAYKFADVPAGTYTATFTKAGYQSQTKSVVVVDKDLAVEAVTLKEGANMTVSVVNDANTSYTGDVVLVIKDSKAVETKKTLKVGSLTFGMDKGDYTLTATVAAGFSVKLDVTSVTISSADVTVKATVTADAGGSSGGGCNVGFAPLALLLLAPVMFLKK